MKKQAEINIEEGKYAIGVRTLKDDADEKSAMAGYLSESAIVTKQDGTISLTVMLSDNETITGFQVENHAGELMEAKEKQVNEETNRRFELFEIDQLISPLRVRVQYEIEHDGRVMKGDEPLRLSFDEESIEKVG